MSEGGLQQRAAVLGRSGRSAALCGRERLARPGRARAVHPESDNAPARGAQFLRQQGLFESREELQQREDVLGRLAAVAVDWVRAVTRALALGDDFADMSHAKIQTFGSYRLGVHGPGAAARAGGADRDGVAVRLGCLREALLRAPFWSVWPRSYSDSALKWHGACNWCPCCLADMQTVPSGSGCLFRMSRTHRHGPTGGVPGGLGADIDTLCIGPRHVTREDHFFGQEPYCLERILTARPPWAPMQEVFVARAAWGRSYRAGQRSERMRACAGSHALRAPA